VVYNETLFPSVIQGIRRSHFPHVHTEYVHPHSCTCSLWLRHIRQDITRACRGKYDFLSCHSDYLFANNDLISYLLYVFISKIWTPAFGGYFLKKPFVGILPKPMVL